MDKRRRGGSRQQELIPYSMRPTIPIDQKHRLVLLTEESDWAELLELVEEIRASKLKSPAGRPPRLRALVGALLFRATRKLSYRETARGPGPPGSVPLVSPRQGSRQVGTRTNLIEAGIGTAKTPRYGFNKPAARSVRKMGVCGQRAVLSFNLNKLARGFAKRRKVELVG